MVRSGIGCAGPNCDVKMVISADFETQIAAPFNRDVRGTFFAMTIELFIFIFVENCLNHHFVCGGRDGVFTDEALLFVGEFNPSFI